MFRKRWQVLPFTDPKHSEPNIESLGTSKGKIRHLVISQCQYLFQHLLHRSVLSFHISMSSTLTHQSTALQYAATTALGIVDPLTNFLDPVKKPSIILFAVLAALAIALCFLGVGLSFTYSQYHLANWYSSSQQY